MSLNEYLDRFHKALEKFEKYGYAVHRPALGFKDHRHSNDGKIYEAALPDIFYLVDEILTHL